MFSWLQFYLYQLFQLWNIRETFTQGPATFTRGAINLNCGFPPLNLCNSYTKHPTTHNPIPCNAFVCSFWLWTSLCTVEDQQISEDHAVFYRVDLPPLYRFPVILLFRLILKKTTAIVSTLSWQTHIPAGDGWWCYPITVSRMAMCWGSGYAWRTCREAHKIMW